MKIAIVGTGISGAAAAWQLKSHAEITFFEQSDFEGGHGYTAELEIDQNPHPVEMDIGVQIIRSDIAPHVFALIESHPEFSHVELSEVPVSFMSRSIYGSKELHYTNMPEYQEEFPFAKGWAEHAEECRRFEELTVELDAASLLLPIKTWLERNHFSKEFAYQILVPSMSLVNVTRNGLLDGLFLTNLGSPSSLVSLLAPNMWYRFSDSVKGFRRVLMRGLEERVRLSTRVIACYTKRNGEVEVLTQTKQEKVEKQTFDALIWSGDLLGARQALDHPENMYRYQHKRALKPFKREAAFVYIHQDASWLPNSMPHVSTAVFEDCSGHGRMHYNLSVLQNKPSQTPVWVSVCKGESTQASKNLLHPVIHWVHPMNNPMTFQAQRQLHKVQGLGGIWFCGAGTVVDGFDACMVSGWVIAERICHDVSYLYKQPKTRQQERASQIYQKMSNMWMFPR